MPDGLTFYTIADRRFYPGVVALLNSLRLTGNDEPLVVLDAGLEGAQRRTLEEHAEVIDPPPAARERPAVLSKPFPHLLSPHGVVVLIDSDIIVTRKLSPVLEAAATGRVCAFPDHASARGRRFSEWEALLGLRAPVRGQTYVNAGFVAFSVERRGDLLARWWQACGDIPVARFGDQSNPFDAGDQDVLNALLMSEVPADALELLPDRLCVYWDELGAVKIADAESLRSTRGGVEVAVLHYSFGPKPWEPSAWARVRRDAFVRLLPRLLFGARVPLRLDPAETPLWLRPGAPGRLALVGIDAVQRVTRAVVYASPEPVKRRALGLRRSLLRRLR